MKNQKQSLTPETDEPSLTPKTDEPSLRHYVRARELKAAGMDWTDVLAVEIDNKRARIAAELLASDAYGSTAERARAFVEHGGGCRATFFNYRRRLNA